MKYSELEKMLKKAGCIPIRGGTRHTIWYSPTTKQKFLVGRHKTEDVKPGTLKSILTAAGLK